MHRKYEVLSTSTDTFGISCYNQLLGRKIDIIGTMIRWSLVEENFTNHDMQELVTIQNSNKKNYMIEE